MDTTAPYRAPWSSSLRLISVLVTLLFLWAGTMLFLGPGASALPRPWLLLLLGVALLSGPFFMVRGYVLDGDQLVILRPGWQTRVPLRGLRSVDPVDLGAGKRLRLFGNGGYWSFTGLYWNSRIGRFRLFANDPSRAVALRFDRRCVVVAPEDPARFVNDVRRHIQPA